MTTINAKVKRWGNSIAIIIPSEVAIKEGIREDQQMTVIVLKDSREAFKKTFGSLKGKIKQSAQEIKDELRRDLYN